jgi:hypothetical protein
VNTFRWRATSRFAIWTICHSQFHSIKLQTLNNILKSNIGRRSNAAPPIYFDAAAVSSMILRSGVAGRKPVTR